MLQKECNQTIKKKTFTLKALVFIKMVVMGVFLWRVIRRYKYTPMQFFFVYSKFISVKQGTGAPAFFVSLCQLGLWCNNKYINKNTLSMFSASHKLSREELVVHLQRLQAELWWKPFDFFSLKRIRILLGSLITEKVKNTFWFPNFLTECKTSTTDVTLVLS